MRKRGADLHRLFVVVVVVFVVFVVVLVVVDKTAVVIVRFADRVGNVVGERAWRPPARRNAQAA